MNSDVRRRVPRTDTLLAEPRIAAAVQRLGRGLRTVARDLDGIKQGIEAVDAPFRIGVQWHPEYLPNQRAQRRLFAALVGQARRRSLRAARAADRTQQGR